MNVTTRITYPGSRLDDVLAMVLSPSFRAAVCDATGATAHDVDVAAGSDTQDEGTVVTVSRTMPARVPDMVRRFVGETITIVQIERWGPVIVGRDPGADVTLRIEGQPASLQGTISLAADPQGVSQVLTGELTVAIPLLGKRFEPEIAKALELAARREEETGRAWLASG